MEKQSYDHGLGEEALIGSTIGAYFDLMAQKQTSSPAIIDCAQNKTISYAHLNELTNSLALALLEIGIGKGDRVGIWSANNWQWVVVQLATAKIGSILVNINPAYQVYELEYALRQSGVKMLFHTSGTKSTDYLHMLKQIAPELFADDLQNPSRLCPDLQHLVLIGADKDNQSHLSWLEEVECFASTGTFKKATFDFLLELGGTLDLDDLSYVERSLQFDDPINIQYTSGTTGFPKGVTLSHHNLLNNSLFASAAMSIDPFSKVCIPVPFYHCAGMVLGTLTAFSRGAAIVIPSPTFVAEAALRSVQEHKCTHLIGVPTMFLQELDHADFRKFDLTSLKGGYIAGAPCPVDLMHKIQKDMHLENLIIIYGQTECSPVITATRQNDSLEIKASTVGRVIPHLEVKIVDTDGKTVERGEQGELCARGYAVMSGYWNNEEATANSIDSSSWLHTGDLAVMNQDGYVNITGRKKDMIIRGGENIYPREIEEVLHGHPSILQAQVFGIPCAKYGETVACWIQLCEGQETSVDEICHWLKERVAYFKVPEYMRIVSTYPMTVTGKVQKHAMRDIMIKELGLEDLAKIQTA